MKKLLLVLTVMLIGLIGFAQDRTNSKVSPKNDKKSDKRERMNTISKMQEEEDAIVFNKHSIFGIKIATDGYGLVYEKGKYKSPRWTSIWQIELNEKLHNKEEKVGRGIDVFGNVSQAKFGKANNFYQLKGGLGQQYTIGGKANRNGVAVTALYTAGLSIGLEKPYYVDAERLSDQARVRIRYSDTSFSEANYNVQGASGVTVGWNGLKIVPGVHAKTALRFDYARFNETVTAVEAGLNAEYYSSKILQMAVGRQNIKEARFFFNAYVAIEFGRRK